MTVLMFTDLFGLREVEGFPMKAVPGTYVRLMGWQDNQIVHTWQVMVRKKDRHGRNVLMEWKSLRKDQLPPKVKIQALLLGIVL